MERQNKSVLFVCTMNAVRSPMAAALLKSLDPSFAVESAGVTTAALDPVMVQTLDEIGVDIGEHRARALAELAPANYDLVVALSPEAFSAAQARFGSVEHWPVSDPTLAEGSREQLLLAYRATRDEILGRLKSRFQTEMA